MLDNDLIGLPYVEPYAGGASVALSLLYEEYASEIYINDIDVGVHAFWRAALDDPAEICHRIHTVSLDMDEWHRQHALRMAGLDQSPDALTYGFATFFLNRTNRSGIIAGGPIGGKQQLGAWKLDARFNREDLCRRVNKISRFRGRIHLSGQDALVFLKTWTQPGVSGFVFLDPPYVEKGSGLYTNHYTPQDHQAVATMANQLSTHWIVSYDQVPEVEALYAEHPRRTYSLSYSANERYRGKEIMFFGPSLVPPAEENPTAVTQADLRGASSGA